jgi:Tfp pilus assembly protein PilE
VVITLWRTGELRDRRVDALESLEALQKAQDRYFAEHARYADSALMQTEFPQGLGQNRVSPGGHYQLEVKSSPDGLGYVATARVINDPDEKPDERCAEIRLDQHGRRTAVNSEGADTTLDCWNRL